MSLQDFVAALAAARGLAAAASRRLGLDVFAYSSVYVFFEQVLVSCRNEKRGYRIIWKGV